ncbi:flavodoxin [archaeon]|nr:flavodoxin [archaeon]
MKALVIYMSVHHQNTKKVAEAISKELKAKLVTVNKFKTIKKYDLIGLGSGIYFGRHHPQLLELIDKLPVSNKKTFTFSTAGLPQLRIINHYSLRKKLKNKGFQLIGDFTCKGYDTYGWLKRIGGIHKGHPDNEDLRRARVFASHLTNKKQ